MFKSFSKLPLGWILVKTGDICEGIVPGRTKPKKFGGTIPWITLPDITALYITKSHNYLAVFREDAEEVGMRVMPKGTVLMSCVGQFGIIGIAVNEVVPNQQLHGFVCLENIPPKFLAYSLMAQVEQMENLASATTISYLNKTKCNSIQIPLPPLNEQKCIVTKIEALQTRSTAVKQELEAIKPLLNQFRQSVLAAAFRGDLTKDWREQNKDNRWEHTTLESVIQDRPRNGYSPKAVDYPTKVKSFSLSATTSGIFKPEYFKYLDKEIKQDSHLWLNPGDILIQRSNTLEYVGTSAIYTGEFGDFVYPDTVMKIQVNEEKVNNKFIHYSLSNKKTRQYFKDNATGTAGNMPKINQKTVMNTPIALPLLKEQKEIVRRIESLFKLADSIQNQQSKIQNQIETLNQSILAKAFRGELVPQDPNDEPASVLLERIREERDKAKPKKSKTEKKRSSKTEDKQLGIPGI